MSERIKGWDEFAEDPKLKLTKDKDNMGTYMGTLLTGMMYLITMIFLYSKAMVLYKETDITVTRNDSEGFFSYEDKFSNDDGLFIAAAITEYDSETENIEDKTIGELTVNHYGWGYEGELGSRKQQLETHPCSDGELGLVTDDKSQVFPIFESSREEVTTWKKKFKCIDRDDAVIWGDYNSRKAQ